jgi:predicted extracellular nuclease
MTHAASRERPHVRRSLAAAAVLLVALLGLPPLGQRAEAVSTTVVISQVYGGGGNVGATYTNDFIELFNRGSTTASLNGWSVQYASSAGTTWQRTDLTNVTLSPGQYYLVQESQGAGGTTPLPTPDAMGTIAMSATAGKVALVNTTTLLTGSGCPFAASVVDLVGYGTAANCSETAPTPTLSNTTAALRGDGGCTETDNNSTDFATGAPTPRNTASPLDPCGGDDPPAVSSTNPADNATGVPVDSNVTITFSEPVDVTGSWFSISCASSGAHTATASGGPTTFTLDPDSDFSQSETCTVTIESTLVTDQDTADPPDEMAADHVVDFQTETPPTEIATIQGSAHLSPLDGSAVSGVQGIVIAERSNGFWMQDPTPDSDDATSDAIFVFTGSAPTVNVGDDVSVSGTVDEFRPGGSASTNLTTTEIVSPTVVISSSGSALPPATIVGTGGRMPPTTVIEDDASGSVETSGVFDPASDGIDFYESLEAMRLQLNNAVASGPTNDFGEISLLPDDGAWAGLRTNRGGIIIRQTDFNPERIFLDDVLADTPDVNVGDHFTAAIVGVLDYSFGNFKLYSSAPVTRVDGGLAREVTAAPTQGQIAVATLNVENLDPGDPATKFQQLAGIVVTNLRSPDVVTLEEVQDNNGPTNDSTTDANLTLDTLVAAIQAAGGPSYSWRQINPVDDQDGGEPGGNIRVAFLFRTDRGITFVDRPGGGSTTPTTVVSGPGGPQLSASPGRIDPTDPAFNTSRKPLVGEFRWSGRPLFVVANHFNSKGGDEPLFGRFQPPTLHSEAQRIQQAEIINDFIDDILALDPSANVVVAGDLNDFPWSPPLQAVVDGGELNNLSDTLPGSERYSYVFEGNSQQLDHILVSDNLLAATSAFDMVHVNSEFFDQASDHEPSVARFSAVSPACDPALTGTSGNDTIVGTTGPDHICGRGGDDTIVGMSGDDIIEGGNGNDTIDAGDGNDVVLGANGNDTIDAGNGNDEVHGGNGNEVIDAGDGNDLVHGDSGNDEIDAGPGDDEVHGGRGNDTIIAGAGDDEVSGDDGNDHLDTQDGIGGNDTANGGPGRDSCAVDVGDVVISCP